MEDNDANLEVEKRRVRSARTSFFSQLLKRTNSQLHAIRYEDTTASFEPAKSSFASTKRLKSLDSTVDSDSDLDQAIGEAKQGEGFIMTTFPSLFQNKQSTTKAKDDFIIHFYDPKIEAEDARGRTLKDILKWKDAQLEYSHDYIQVLFPLPEGSMFSFNAPIITREVVDAFHRRPELKHTLRLAFDRMLKFYGFAVSAELEENARESKEERTHEQKEVDKQQAEPGAETEGQERGEDQAIQATDEQDSTEKVSNNSKESSLTSTISNGVQQSDTQTGASGPLESQAAKVEPDTSTATEAQTRIVRSENWQRAFRNWAVRMDHNHLRISRILRCLRVLGLEKECEAFYTALKEVFNDPDIRINERSMMFWRRAVRQPLHIAPDGERVPWLKVWAEEQEQQYGEEV